MEVDPIRVSEVLVGLGDVEVLGVDDEHGEPLRVHFRRRAPRPDCLGCGGRLWSDAEREVELVDLPAFDRPIRLVWRTAQAPTRWLCEQPRSWLVGIGWAVLDLAGPYRAALNTALPHAKQVADLTGTRL